MTKTLRKRNTKRNIRKNKKSIRRRRANKKIIGGWPKFTFTRTPTSQIETTDQVDPDALTEEEKGIFREREGEIPVRFYEVIGLGCHISLETDSNDKRFCEQERGTDSVECSTQPNIYENSQLKVKKISTAINLDINEENVFILCNTLGSALENIVSLWFKSKIPLFPDYFYTLPVDSNANYVYMKSAVIDDVTKGKRVFIKGHSFGGAIVNRLAIDLQNYAHSNSDSDFTKNINKLFILALGSIYVAPFNLVSKIQIFNAMNTGDVAVKVNGLTIPIDSIRKQPMVNGLNCYQSNLNQTLIWLHDEGRYKYYENSKESNSTPQAALDSLFGSKIEWRTHNDYPISFRYLNEIKRQINGPSDVIDVEALKQKLFPGIIQLS